MNILIIGNGGREHAIAWKAARSTLVDLIYCASGNGGTYYENKCCNINLETIDELAVFAKDNKIGLTIVGPETPLVEGIVDRFKEEGLCIFGPSKAAAELEGSKSYAKAFMRKYGVKTAWFEVFDDIEAARSFLNGCTYPLVIKADGLAAGKGVVICNTLGEGLQTVEDFMVRDIFKGAGKKIIIEEFLEGIEASILSITDGKTIIPFVTAKDHKCIFDGNLGPNTGGMGVIAPNPFVTGEVQECFEKDIMLPTLLGIQKENLDYTGVIFFGIMLTKKGVYLLEYNVRMGDPETQAVLPLMKSDFIELILSAIEGKLGSYKPEWLDAYSCCVAAVSSGYPGNYKTGYDITVFNEVKNKIFFSGAKVENERLTTTGGRVLAISAVGKSLEAAIGSAYSDIEKIYFDGIYYRRDIGEI